MPTSIFCPLSLVFYPLVKVAGLELRISVNDKLSRFKNVALPRHFYNRSFALTS